MKFWPVFFLIVGAVAAYLGFREMAGIPADAARGVAIISFILFFIVLFLGRNKG